MCAGENIVAGSGEGGDVKKLALAVFGAFLTIPVMVTEEEFNTVAAGFRGFGAGDKDFHPFTDGIDTTGDEATCPLDFDQADSAAASRALTVVKRTQRWDVVTATTGGFENGEAFFDLEGLAIDANVYFCHGVSLLSFDDGAETAGRHTHATFNAAILVNEERFFAWDA